ncbi:hypothetical protein [Enterobacter hormaechei]|uniref:hypothetical protein n=1 Tax=Enterobacter hormaechei TaxID=158836 RepID=UPI001253616D|nr:hypothetical protein [Enterobacter hormaechei]VAE09907.1 Uncharacterised protein [Enterobacter hormaechei]VAF41366.1 Uncharacterised protein [Enterobacter hormaechei]
MSVLPFDLTDKIIQPTNQFIFLTGTEDFTIPKCAAAKAAKAAGQKTFIYPCKRHGITEHYASNSHCVECSNKQSITRYYNNREHCLATVREWKKKNPGYGNHHYHKNKEHISAQRKERWSENTGNIRGKVKSYHQNNRALVFAIATCERMSLPYKNLKQRLPYSEQDFREHIESLWLDGMNWGNRGNGDGFWNIDHKIPVSHFTKIGETDIAVINALSNLQPLWHRDNMKKRDSLEHVTG